MNERDDNWWREQDDDDAWVQKMLGERDQALSEREKKVIEFFKRLGKAYEKDYSSIPTQLELPLEDTRAREEIEAEYDAFMERLEKEERDNQQEKQS